MAAERLVDGPCAKVHDEYGVADAFGIAAKVADEHGYRAAADTVQQLKIGGVMNETGNKDACYESSQRS